MGRYVPPISGVSVRLPEDAAAVAVELAKQESLLAQIHGEMCSSRGGAVAKHRQEQLWEAQRIVTQLKRQLRLQPTRPAATPAAPPTVAAAAPTAAVQVSCPLLT